MTDVTTAAEAVASVVTEVLRAVTAMEALAAALVTSATVVTGAATVRLAFYDHLLTLNRSHLHICSYMHPLI